MIDYARVNQLVSQALELSMPDDVRALLSSAFAEMNPPPAFGAPTPVPDLPGVVQLAPDHPYWPRAYEHSRTGRVLFSLEEARGYVTALAERDANLDQAGSFADMYAKREAQRTQLQPGEPIPEKPISGVPDGEEEL